MTIQKIKKLSSKTNAFTLVELIIVITILAILATIAFISFKNYTGNARDGNKLTTLANIEKGLSLYQIKTGSYPTPDDVYGSGNYNSTPLGEVGYVKTNVAQAINMNTVPKDPIVNHEYTYGISNDKKYYQLGTVLENNETSFIPQTYANNYTSKVVGNYKGLYRFKANSNNYIINLPSLIFTQSGSQSFENTANNPKFVINNGGNLVQPYDENNKEDVNTVLEKLTQKEDITFTGIVIPTDWNAGSGTLAQELGYTEDEIGYEIFGEKYYTDKSSLNTSGIQWKDIPGTSCNNDDYVFTQGGVTYRWAGCNSVLGNGVEWGKLDDGSDGNIGSCYSYNGVSHIENCPIAVSGNAMYSSSKEKDWSEANAVTHTVNNIWGKLYTYAQATSTIDGACPSGWSLPSEADWSALETYLNESVCRTSDGFQCEGLGWSGDASKNMVKELKIPLSGFRDAPNPNNFMFRGYASGFWSNSSPGTTVYTRSFSYDNNGIQRFLHDMNYGFSVRCIKK